LRLFVDNNLALKHARSLEPLLAPAHSIVHLRDMFAADTPDEVWLRQLKSEGEWVVLSGDIEIIRNNRSVLVWKACGLTTFFFVEGWMHIELMEQHAKLTKCIQPILTQAARAVRGSAYKVKMNGKLEAVQMS
jgi:PIN like domain